MITDYDMDNLYVATIIDHGVILSMDNVGGCISFSSEDEPSQYSTILHIYCGEMIDLDNPSRVMNSEIETPAMETPRISNDGHLYTVVENSMVKYKDALNKNTNSLVRIPNNNQTR